MRRFFTLLALLSTLTLVAAACGGTKDTGFALETPEPTEEEHGEDTSTLDDPAAYSGPIEVGDNFFGPRFVTVGAGTEVAWDQIGLAPHNVQADDDSFNSSPGCSGSDIGACMAEGDEFDLVFDEPGEYPYYCIIHGRPGAPEDPSNMAGVIIVT